MIKIKRLYTDEIIHSGEFDSIKDCLVDGVSKNISFNGADLYEADLCKANLYGANLRKADLDGADLYGVKLCKSNLYGANLRKAKGIKTYTAGNENRLCYTYITNNKQRFQLGCFNGNLEEACIAIEKKYGKNSHYERITRAYGGIFEGDK